MEDKKKIIDFLEKIANQDNRITAAPYFYVIRTSVEVPAYEGCGDRVYWYSPEDPEIRFESIEEYIEHAKEYECYSDMDEEDKEKFNNRMETIEWDLTKVEVSDSWQERGMFLTETDAKRHLEANRHHYSDDAHTYVKHAWRAPELEEFFCAMYRYFDVDKGNLDLNLK